MLKGVAEYLTKVVSPVSRILNNLSMVVLAGVMFLVVVDVLVRRLFNTPIIGTHDIATVGFALIVFLPMGLCTLTDRHVSLAVVVDRLPKKLQQVVAALIMLLTTATLGVTSLQLLKQGIRLHSMNGETPVLGIPYAPFAYLATLGMVLMTFGFFIKFLLALSSTVEKNQ